ncbi:DUF4352 domain-containing protein [Alkalihalobacillus trypoxylicola]|uniref:DUF4352 domain-containing protein n=1 Tax=Alkalihalobacillus trypoxylicola TaxID=519424 RepID=A0A162DG78_9BACI|nr:DUF4352 domain-containing protein [Alkalihalobacillus trypoxylicola]KYG29520.1 hypothetical protein AZF04_08345 [Alkalihalobacillus trypoxylicola]
MKVATKLLAPLLGVSFLLVACGDSNGSENGESLPNDEVIEEEDDTMNDDSEQEASGEAGEDQMDLVVGDTAIMHSNISSFEFTLNSVEMVEELDGEEPELDGYIIASITIKNIGDEAIDAQETSRVFEYTDFLEGSGMSDQSQYTEQYEGVEGEIAPGDEMTGTAVYHGYIDEENYLRVKPGLAGTGLINDAIFTFTLE